MPHCDQWNGLVQNFPLVQTLEAATLDFKRKRFDHALWVKRSSLYRTQVAFFVTALLIVAQWQGSAERTFSDDGPYVRGTESLWPN